MTPDFIEVRNAATGQLLGIARVRLHLRAGESFRWEAPDYSAGRRFAEAQIEMWRSSIWPPIAMLMVPEQHLPIVEHLPGFSGIEGAR